MLYIGIDPGLNGAAASIDTMGGSPWVTRTPTIMVGKRRQCDLSQMVRLFEGFPLDKYFATLEAVHSMPKQGVASSFSFGMGYGMWQGILAALAIPYQLVSPQAWKKVMLCDTDKSKGAAKLVAARLWPQLGKLTDGEAESLLMAEYGRWTHGKR